MPTFFARFAICVGALAPFVGACHRGHTDASASTQASAAPSASSSSSQSSFPVPKASVDLVLNPQGLPEYSGPTGSVEGTIRVQGPPPPVLPVNIGKCPAALDTYGKLFRDGTPEKPNGPRALADAVVVAVGYTGFAMPEKNDAVHVTIGPNCAYPSRTIALTYGQRLEVSNQTRLLFAPKIEQDENVAVMVAPPLEAGAPVRLYPEKAGYFPLVDTMEPFVHEDLYVFRHPLHAVTDTAGHYRLDGLPVGKLTIGAHHPAFDSDASAPVEVVAGAVQNVDLTLTYKPSPKRVDAGAPLTRRCLRWVDPTTKLKCAEYDRPND